MSFSSNLHSRCWTEHCRDSGLTLNSSDETRALPLWQSPQLDAQDAASYQQSYHTDMRSLYPMPSMGFHCAYPEEHRFPEMHCWQKPDHLGHVACPGGAVAWPMVAQPNSLQIPWHTFANMQSVIAGMAQFQALQDIVGETFAPQDGQHRGTKKRRRKNRKPRLRRRPMLHDEETLQERELRSGGIVGPISTSQCHLGWESVLYDEIRRSFVSIRKAAFREDMLAEWWKLCYDEIYWDRGVSKNDKVLERSSAWLTTDGCQCCYVYSDMRWLPVEMPPWLKQLTETVCQKCGIVERPNSCNLNFYKDGSEFIGWHYDDEPLLDAVENDALIISLSLGASRWFELRAADDPDVVNEKVRLEHGDICTMEGLCQKHFRHCVHREPEVDRPRINITWRWVVHHEEQCPLFAGDCDDDASDEQCEYWKAGGTDHEIETFAFK